METVQNNQDVISHGFPDIFVGSGAEHPRIACYRWGEYTVRQPVGAVIVVHGLGEHANRYGGLVAALNAQNLIVFGLDHRGHGRSEGPRAFCNTWRELVDDVETYAYLVAKELPKHLPLFIFGHSMGGLIATLLTLRLSSVKEGEEGKTPFSFTDAHRRELGVSDFSGFLCGRIRGVVLSGAAVGVGESIGSVTITLGKAVANVAPHTGVEQLDAAEISTLPEEVTKYKEDPLVLHGSVTAGLGVSLLSGIELAQKFKQGFNYPALHFVGTEDRLVNKVAIEDLYTQQAHADKTFFKVEGSRHETLNDKDRETVTQRVVTWIVERVK